jgi:hypothetical protein
MKLHRALMCGNGVQRPLWHPFPLEAAARTLCPALPCRGTPPLARFQFKHPLVRDVAYGSLLVA